MVRFIAATRSVNCEAKHNDGDSDPLHLRWRPAWRLPAGRLSVEEVFGELRAMGLAKGPAELRRQQQQQHGSGGHVAGSNRGG